MTPETLQLFAWASGISSLIALATTIWNLLMSGSRANAKRIDAVEASATERGKQIDERFAQGSRRMDDLTRRTDAIETTLHQMPGKDDVHAIQLEVARMAGSMGKIEAAMEGIQKLMERQDAILSRHEDHLLGGKP